MYGMHGTYSVFGTYGMRVWFVLCCVVFVVLHCVALRCVVLCCSVLFCVVCVNVFTPGGGSFGKPKV